MTTIGTTSTPSTVLVTDDDPLNRAMLSMSLTSAGHSVVEAENGREALAVLAAQSIDVVLTDIEMPVMNGYELLEHRHGNSRLREVPFIVISGVDEMASVSDAIAAEFPDLTVETVVAEGRAADAITRHAEGAEMVVLGHRHQGRLSRLLHGSTSQATLDHLACPLVIVPCDDEGRDT